MRPALLPLTVFSLHTDLSSSLVVVQNILDHEALQFVSQILSHHEESSVIAHIEIMD
jgi:hypothetical protein